MVVGQQNQQIACDSLATTLVLPWYWFTKVSRTTGLFSSPGAVLLTGEGSDVLEDVEMVRQVTRALGESVHSQWSGDCTTHRSTKHQLAAG